MDMKLPAIDEIVFALGELPLGEGNEARVYKIHTNPKFTVRVSKDCRIENMTEYLYNTPFVREKDVFEGRNFAQTVGYFEPPKKGMDPNVTVNLYCPGFSFELNRDYLSKINEGNSDSNTTLIKTRLLTEKLLELPDDALIKTFDDMKFLSSKRYSLDSGGGYFMNTGNILYSEVDKKLFIIDLLPFVYHKPGVSPEHIKGFNTPYFFLQGILPGSYHFKKEHAQDPALRQLRTEVFYKVIKAAQKAELNDVGGYLKGTAEQMQGYWRYQMTILGFEEKERDRLLKEIYKIKDTQPYTTPDFAHRYLYSRINGNEFD
jgi:hypothetical protein